MQRTSIVIHPEGCYKIRNASHIVHKGVMFYSASSVRARFLDAKSAVVRIRVPDAFQEPDDEAPGVYVFANHGTFRMQSNRWYRDMGQSPAIWPVNFRGEPMELFFLVEDVQPSPFCIFLATDDSPVVWTDAAYVAVRMKITVDDTGRVMDASARMTPAMRLIQSCK